MSLTRAWFADARLRFLLAGGSAALLNWLVRFPLSEVLPFSAAVVLSQAIGMVYAFFIYRNWVFRPTGPVEKASRLAEAARFLAVNGMTMIATLLVALVVRYGLMLSGVGPFVADALGHGIGIAAGAVLNFFGHRAITFRSS